MCKHRDSTEKCSLPVDEMVFSGVDTETGSKYLDCKEMCSLFTWTVKRRPIWPVAFALVLYLHGLFIPAWSQWVHCAQTAKCLAENWAEPYSSFCQWMRQCSHETYTSPHLDLEDTKPFCFWFLFSFCMMLKFMTMHHQLGQKKASGSEDTEQYPITWTGRTVILIIYTVHPPTPSHTTATSLQGV